MTTTDLAPTRISVIQQELDQARAKGALQNIVIPPCPELLTRLQKAMAAGEPDLNEVARIAYSDVAMSATLLRSANGPLYAGGQPVQSIGQAMNRLGLSETAAILTGFMAQNTIRVTSSHLQGFWEFAAQRALAMAFIAKRLPGMSPDLAYTYGLFCHVGLPVMMQSVKGYVGTMVEAQARVDRSYVATENANHRTDHAVVGALVARVWRLSPSLMAAIRLHHDLAALGDRFTEPEVHTLVAAGLLADHLLRLQEGLPPEKDWVAYGPKALEWLQISADELAVWADEVMEMLEIG
ncbi:HDOD domain-containing protein [Aquabacterium sp.]|uniref:HDOD domain-containing protein n=1 Tax=Aquabacterium sp. TaxID=1872578 RepID=UPI0019CD34E2|nr:HDOD domain-containing protein [Aquabacterium sp.]MBC7701955.1 HDOD domain-containing protein [Aquabacterium sp.]